MHIPRLHSLALASGLALTALAAPPLALDATAQVQDTARAAPGPTSRPAAPDGATREPRPRRDRNRLSHDEIVEGNQGNMLEVIRAKRPNWLRRNNADRSWSSPGERVALFVNGTDQSGDHMLSDFSPTQIIRAEYVSTTDAVVLYGPRYSKGIILLFTH